MYNLLKLLIKYHAFLLFLCLELLAGVLVFQYNGYQKSWLLNSTLEISGSVYQFVHDVSSYLSLRNENELLAAENAWLKSQLKNPIVTNVEVFPENGSWIETNVVDTTSWYRYIPCKVISSTIYQQSNMLFINKGEKDGIRTGMGIMHRDGIAGVVTNTSAHFSVIMPIIHKDFRTTATLKEQGYFGNLSWPGKNPSVALLTEIPGHVEVNKGDLIVTSGFSERFPADVLIGSVIESRLNVGTSFLEIEVQLSVDYRKIQYVYAAEYIYKNELDSITHVIPF